MAKGSECPKVTADNALELFRKGKLHVTAAQVGFFESSVRRPSPSSLLLERETDPPFFAASEVLACWLLAGTERSSMIGLGGGARRRHCCLAQVRNLLKGNAKMGSDAEEQYLAQKKVAEAWLAGFKQPEEAGGGAAAQHPQPAGPGA